MDQKIIVSPVHLKQIALLDFHFEFDDENNVRLSHERYN